MTQHPQLFHALAAPFEPHEVKVRSHSGRQMHYVTARTAMNRLDSVVGPENWWDEYVPNEKSVLCRLTLRLPDGQLLTKCDAGGYAGMADEGDDDKSGYSDAFKRACVKFGVGRYLYRDGVPTFGAPAPAAQPQPTAPPPPAQPKPKPGPAPKAATNGRAHGANGKAAGPWTGGYKPEPGSTVTAGTHAAIAAAKEQMSPPMPGEKLASAKQIQWIRDIAANRGITEADLMRGVREYYGCDALSDLERKQASDLIGRLSKPEGVDPESN